MNVCACISHVDVCVCLVCVDVCACILHVDVCACLYVWMCVHGVDDCACIVCVDVDTRVDNLGCQSWLSTLFGAGALILLFLGQTSPLAL